MREYNHFQISLYFLLARTPVPRYVEIERTSVTLTQGGRRDEMTALLSEDLLELFATVATYDKLGVKLQSVAKDWEIRCRCSCRLIPNQGHSVKSCRTFTPRPLQGLHHGMATYTRKLFPSIVETANLSS